VKPLEELGVEGGGGLGLVGVWLGVLLFAAWRPVAGWDAAGGVAGRASTASRGRRLTAAAAHAGVYISPLVLQEKYLLPAEAIYL